VQSWVHDNVVTETLKNEKMKIK